MSGGSFGRAPAVKAHDDFAFRTIHHGCERHALAVTLWRARRTHGRESARHLLSYLLYLGTYPVRGSARWRNLYGKCQNAPLCGCPGCV